MSERGREGGGEEGRRGERKKPEESLAMSLSNCIFSGTETTTTFILGEGVREGDGGE